MTEIRKVSITSYSLDELQQMAQAGALVGCLPNYLIPVSLILDKVTQHPEFESIRIIGKFDVYIYFEDGKFHSLMVKPAYDLNEPLSLSIAGPAYLEPGSYRL